MTDRTVTVHLNLAVSRFLKNSKESEDAIKRVRRQAELLELKASAFTRTGLAASMAALPSALAPVAAGIAVLPALAFTGAAAFTTLAVAVNGVGGALKAVNEGDPKKTAEALSKLSSEARAFVEEYARVKPAFSKLGDSTQGALFRPLLGDLEKLAGVWVPALLDKMPRLAGEFGHAGHELAGWANSAGTVKKITGQIDLASDTTHDWVMLLRNGLDLMLELADSAAPFTRTFVHGLSEGTLSLGRFVREARASGQMAQLFVNGGAGLHEFNRLLAETGDLLFDILANPSLVSAARILFGTLRTGLELVHGFVNVFSMLPAPVQMVVGTFFSVAAVVLLVAGRIAALKAGLANLTVKLNEVGVAGESTGRRLERFGRTASRALTVAAALTAVGGVAKELRSTGISVDALSGALERFGKTGERSSTIALQFGQDFEQLQRDIRRASLRGLDDLKGGAQIEGLFGNVSSIFTKNSDALILDRIQQIDQGLAALARSGHAQEAQNALFRLGVTTDQAAKIFPEYTAAAQNAAKSTQDLSRAHRAAAMNAAILNEGLAGAVRLAGSLRDAFDALHGDTLSFAKAELNAEEAVSRFTQSLKDNGKTLDVHTQAGQENKRSLIGGIEAAIDAAQAKYNTAAATKGETVALQEANAVYQQYIDALRKAMLAAGMNKDEVNKLLSAYASMPPMIATSITTPGLDSAIAKTLRLLELRRQLGSNVAAANAYDNSGYTSGRRWGGITQHARDGLLGAAGVYPARHPARYAFAEPGTGGEAFVPRFGDYRRSMSILEQAAGWYGAMVAPAGRSDTASKAPQYPTAAEIGRAVKAALNGVAVVLDGRVVGRMQARQADLYARGG